MCYDCFGFPLSNDLILKEDIGSLLFPGKRIMDSETGLILLSLPQIQQ